MYKRKFLKLDNVIQDVAAEIIPKAQRITSAFILRMPAGVSISLKFGENSDPIAIDSTIVPLAFDVAGDDGNNGLYWLNPVANAGQQVELFVSTLPPEDQPANRESVGPGPRPGLPPFSH